MSFFKRFVSILLAAAMLVTALPAMAEHQVQASQAYSSTITGLNGTKYTQDRSKQKCLIYKGIDVSVYQGDIDWQAVKAAGVEFAFIRATMSSVRADSRLIENLNGAKAAGLLVGVYCYSYATSTAAAEKEADFLLDQIAGYQLDLPAIIDMEEKSQLALSSAGKLAVINAFCRRIEQGGYEAGVYASSGSVLTKLDLTDFDYFIWAARYNTVLNTTSINIGGKFNCWQYTSSGKVNGISGKVDSNFLYVGETIETETFEPDPDSSEETGQETEASTETASDSSTEISAGTDASVTDQIQVTGYYTDQTDWTTEQWDITLSNTEYTYSGAAKKPGVTVKDSAGNQLVKNQDYTLTYVNNINAGTATVYVVGTGSYSGATAHNYTIAKKDQTLKITAAVTSAAAGSVRTYTASGCKTSLSHSSTDTAVVDVNSQGQIGFLSPGKAEITFTADGNENYNQSSVTVSFTCKPGSPGEIALANTATGIKITWNRSSLAESYSIYRSTDGISYSKVKTIKKNTTLAWTDTTVKRGGRLYFYKVLATANGIDSDRSKIYGIHSLDAPATAKAALVSKGIKLTWSKVSGAGGYYIYRKTEDGSYTRIAEVSPASSLSFTDTAAAGDVTYIYTVRSYKTSSTTTSASWVMDDEVTIYNLSAPEMKTLKAVDSGLKLTWAKTSGAEKYIVYRKTGSGSYEQLAEVKSGSAATISYTDKDLTAGKKYTYTVKAVSGETKSACRTGLSIKWTGKADSATATDSLVSGNSESTSSSSETGTESSSKDTAQSSVSSNTDKNAASTESSAASIAKKPSIKSFKQETKTAGKATVRYSQADGAAGYQIAYSTSSSFAAAKTTTLNITSGDCTAWTINDLKKGKKYYVRVRSYVKVDGKTSYSSWSAKKSLKITY